MRWIIVVLMFLKLVLAKIPSAIPTSTILLFRTSSKFGNYSPIRSSSSRSSVFSRITKTILLRGGKTDAHSSVPADDEAYESTNNNDEEDDNEDTDDNEDFEQRKPLPMVSTVTSIWNKTPPMTQVYIASSMCITLLSFLLNKNKWPDFLHFDWGSIFTGQVWRLYTAFLFFGQLDMFYPLTMQFVWQHMAQLEKLNYSKPEEFLVMLLFGAGTLITLYSLLGISMKFLGHNLATFLVYIWSRVFEGSDVNFMDLLTLKAEMLPWFFCAQTFLLEREVPLADLIGIVVGHIYYYLKQKKVLKAPEAMRKWFQSEQMQLKYAKFKSDFE